MLGSKFLLMLVMIPAQIFIFDQLPFWNVTLKIDLLFILLYSVKQRDIVYLCYVFLLSFVLDMYHCTGASNTIAGLFLVMIRVPMLRLCYDMPYATLEHYNIKNTKSISLNTLYGFFNDSYPSIDLLSVVLLGNRNQYFTKNHYEYFFYRRLVYLVCFCL